MNIWRKVKEKTNETLKKTIIKVLKNAVASIVKVAKKIFSRAWFVKKGKEDEAGSLRKIVEKEKNIDNRTKRILKKENRFLWELLSGTAIDFIFIALYLASLMKVLAYKFPEIIELLDRTKDDLINIHIGIGAVLVSLSFLVANKLARKDDDFEEGVILLYASKFPFLLSAEIVILLIFIIGGEGAMMVAMVGVLGVMTIERTVKTVDSIIVPSKMEKQKQKMFFGILRKSFLATLDNEIGRRIGENKLYEKAKEIKEKTNGLVKINPLGASNESSYRAIKIDKLGIIADISFQKIEELRKEIVDIGEEKRKKEKTSGFTTGADRVKKGEDVGEKEVLGYILQQFQWKITEKNNEIVQVKESIFSEDDKEKEIQVQKIEKIALEIFDIKEDLTHEEESRGEILRIKDSCVNAIKKEETDKLEKTTVFYLKLIKEYFKYMKPYGGGFSSKQARQERGSIMGKIKPLEWILEDVLEIFEKGLQSKNRNIAREVAFLPINIAKEAIENNDHLIFQEFIEFTKRLYIEGLEKQKSEEEGSQLIIDRAWRYAKELADYKVEPIIEDKKSNEESREGAIDFAIHLLKTFQWLIKESFDREDFKHFKLFCKKANSLFQYNEHKYWKEEDIEEKQAFIKIKRKKEEMFFGIAAWILYKTEDVGEIKGEKNEKAIEFFEEISNNYISKDIQEITSTFLATHSFEIEGFWGWGYWELEEKDQDSDGLHQINALEKLEKLYVVEALKVLGGKTTEEIQNIELEIDRDLAQLAEGTRELMNYIKDIEESPEKWKTVFKNNEQGKVGDLKKLLEKVKEGQEREDLARKRTGKISIEKVNQFKENVLKDFENSNGMRNILKHYGLFNDQSRKRYAGNLGKVGVNTLFEKAAFFEDWHIHFASVENGFDFGRTMARGENDRILEKVKAKLQKIEEEEFENEIQGIENPIIIATNGAHWSFLDESHRNKKFAYNRNPEKQKDSLDELIGTYVVQSQEIPVYEIYENSDQKSILVLDKEHLGKLIQYSPLDEEDLQGSRKDIFQIEVEEFKTKKGESFLLRQFLFKEASRPKWLEEKGRLIQQKEYLQERIVIKIFERFEFKPEKVIKGFKIEVNKV